MRLLARQMSGPVPSPSMNGTIGWLGTLRRPSVISMRWPSLGGVNCSSTDIGRPSWPHLRHGTNRVKCSAIAPGSQTWGDDLDAPPACAVCSSLDYWSDQQSEATLRGHAGTEALPTGPAQPGV